MLNKNTLGVKKAWGQLETALQTGATKNFDISWGHLFNYLNDIQKFIAYFHNYD